MFAYCLNNPVNYTDTKGSACKLIFSDCFDTLKSPWQDPTGGGGRTGSRIYYTPKYGKDQKEQQVLNTLKGQGITYYNGALVVNFSSSFLSSFSIANVIFLESSQHYIDTLRHEHGHIQQQREFGAMKYLFLVFIPSATYNLISRHDSTLASCYYSMPWEYDADMRSNIQRAGHKSWAKKLVTSILGYLGDSYEKNILFCPCCMSFSYILHISRCILRYGHLWVLCRSGNN